MYHFIKGTLEETGKDYIVIENNGVGYKIFVSSSTFGRLSGTSKDNVKIYTYFHVREDIMALYGFLSREELEMFEMLISVSGVGPKAGLAVLSVLPPEKLSLSIIGGDIKALTSVPGIGSKTAHRIILELKDKIDENGLLESGFIEAVPEYSGGQEAIRALISLGYSSNEANGAMKRVDINGKNTEDIIKEALKILMK